MTENKINGGGRIRDENTKVIVDRDDGERERDDCEGGGLTFLH
jgi:hypothetical protein